MLDFTAHFQTIRTFNTLSNELKYVHPRMFKLLIRKKTIKEIPDD